MIATIISCILVPCILGTVFTSISLASFFYFRNIIKNAIKVDAIVIKSVPSNVPEVSGYCPVLRYHVNGKLFETQYNIANFPPKYPDGTELQIYCHEKNPKRIVLQDDKVRKIIQASFFAGGIFSFCLAILFSVLFF